MKNINYRFFLTLILVLIANSLFSQIKVQGTITTKKNEKAVSVPFANIVFYDRTDTTKIVVGGVTDFEGNYVFENLKTGLYFIEISCIGYKNIRKEIQISLPSIGNVLKQNFQMKEDSQMLSEVVVEGSRTIQYVDKIAYTFTQKEIKSARYSKDLIETLPQLTTDARTGRLKDIRGGAMQILINGVCATDNELKLLPPNQVLKVEYYDIPPARYAKNGSVVNIITKTLTHGYNGGFDLSHAFTTGFANDDVYFKYNKGRNQFIMEYAINYRNYKERDKNQIYKYKLNHEDRESWYLKKDAFGYTTHTIGLKFTNQLQDKYVFQIGLQPNFHTRFSEGTKNIFNNFGTVTQNYSGIFNSDIKVISPVVDVYFWKRLTQNSDISFNVVGTIFRTEVDKENLEFELPNMTESLTDVMHLENRKQSLIGELVYTKNMNIGKFSAGYKISSSWLNSDISNIFGNYDYDSRYNEQYLYSEFSGKKNKLLYRMSLGGTLIHNNSYSNKYNKFIFTPQLMIGYTFTTKHTLRFIAKRTTNLPSVSNLSNNAELLTPNIISVGNPMLNNETLSSATLTYSHNSKYLNLNMGTFYYYFDNAINEYFIYKPGDVYITRTKENANSACYYGGYLRGAIKPFGTDIFTLKINSQVSHQKVNSDLVGNISHWYIPLYVSGLFKYKNVTISYSYQLPATRLTGAYLNNDENHSFLNARYRYKSFSFSTGVFWIATPSKYHTETLEGSLVDYTSDVKIWDNKTMFVFGFSYNFNKGASYTTKRKLKNKDTDAGTF